MTVADGCKDDETSACGRSKKKSVAGIIDSIRMRVIDMRVMVGRSSMLSPGPATF